MASFSSLNDIINQFNADIECELCKKRFSGMTAFVGHPCRDDEGKYLVGILLYLRLSETRVKIEGLTVTQCTNIQIFYCQSWRQILSRIIKWLIGLIGFTTPCMVILHNFQIFVLYLHMYTMYKPRISCLFITGYFNWKQIMKNDKYKQ